MIFVSLLITKDFKDLTPANPGLLKIKSKLHWASKTTIAFAKMGWPGGLA